MEIIKTTDNVYNFAVKLDSLITMPDDFDPAKGMVIRTYLNGELKQDAKTDLLMWDVPFLMEFITDCMTLLPGDIVSTGTPVNVGPMKKGDKVTVCVEGIGELTNTIV